MQPGDFRNKVGFYPRIETDDGYGNIVAGYPDAPAFTARANIKPKLGGEQVLAERLTGTNLLQITVRQSTNTKQVNPAWQLKDEHSGAIYNFRSIVDPYQGTAEHGQYFEILAEHGVA